MAEQIIPVDVEKIMEEIRQEIKEKGVGYVYSIVNEDDIVPRLNVKCIYEALNEVNLKEGSYM